MGNAPRIFLGAFLGVLFGAVLIMMGFQEKELAGRSSAQPEEIALKDLIARGPSGNPNILLKDFALCANFVYTEKNSRWESAWVPVVPSGAATPLPGQPAQVQALIYTTHAQNEQELTARCGQPKLRAMVTNGISSVSGQEKSLLERTYPGTNFAGCLIIHEGREPAGTSKVMFMIGGGWVLVIGSLGVLGWSGWTWASFRLGLGGSRKKKKKKKKKVRVAEDEDEEFEERPRKKKRRVVQDDDD